MERVSRERLNGGMGVKRKTELSPSYGPASENRNAQIIFAGLTIMFVISFLYHAPTGDYFTICMFKNVTGIPCPGCGLTHAFCSFAKGHLVEALKYNAMGPPLFVILIFVWVRYGSVLLRKTRVAGFLDRSWKRLRLTAVFATAFTLYGIGRMVYILIYSPHAVHPIALSHLLGAR